MHSSKLPRILELISKIFVKESEIPIDLDGLSNISYSGQNKVADLQKYKLRIISVSRPTTKKLLQRQRKME